MKSYQTIGNYRKIKGKLIILYILNLTDIIFTLLFHNTGYFVELNPVMQKLLNNQTSVFMIKLIVPLLLFWYLCVRLKKATDKQLQFANKLILALFIFYLIINLMHIITFFTLFYYQIL